jgi:hypothetical protein
LVQQRFLEENAVPVVHWARFATAASTSRQDCGWKRRPEWKHDQLRFKSESLTLDLVKAAVRKFGFSQQSAHCRLITSHEEWHELNHPEELGGTPEAKKYKQF